MGILETLAVVAVILPGSALAQDRTHGICGTPARDPLATSSAGGPGDCGLALNDPDPQYSPAAVRELTVVFHVIERTDGTGHLTPATIEEQLDRANEHFRALPGTPGAGGTDARIRFRLASRDPQGQPSSGITYTVNDNWFADAPGYWNQLAWDPARYVNVYTNSCGNQLGYVPDLPQAGIVGLPHDRIVLAWDAVGSGSPIGPPYDQGKVLTHELGHYLGLWHVFQGGCDGPAGCSASGDLICDTAPESIPSLGGCMPDWACGGPSAYDNYMSYSDQACQVIFTEEQSRRMRCTLEHWRPLISRVVDVGAPYCPALPNSAGAGAVLRAEGSAKVAHDDLALLVDLAPPQKVGLFLFAPNAASLPFGDGILCLGGGVGRIPPPQWTNAAGRLTARLQLAAPPLSGVAVPGSTTRFQFWFRDGAGGPAGVNLSNGLALTWQ